MDPRAHAMAMEQVGQGILAVAEMEEKRLDAQLKGLENLGEFKKFPCDESFARSHYIVFNRRG